MSSFWVLRSQKRTKAVRRMLVKLTPGLKTLSTSAKRCLCHEHFTQSYLHVRGVLCSFFLITVWLCNFLAKEYCCKSCSQIIAKSDCRSTAYLQSKKAKTARSSPKVPQTAPAMVPRCSSRLIRTMESRSVLLGANVRMASQPRNVFVTC